MRKKIALLLAAFIAAGLVSGCQSTPEKPIVIGKNLDLLIEKTTRESPAQGGPLEVKLGAPGEYVLSERYLDGSVTLSANVRVHIPQADRVPVVRVAPADFSQETVDRFYGALIGDAAMYQVVGGRPTKAYLEAEILKYRKIMDAADCSQTQKQACEQAIAALQEEYAYALDALAWERAGAQIATQYEYHPRTHERIGQYQGVDISGNPDPHVSDVKVFQVRNNAAGGSSEFIEDTDGSGGGVLIDNASRGARLYFRDGGLGFKDGENSLASWGLLDGMQLPDFAEKAGALTPEEALEQADQLLLDAGIADMRASAVELLLVFDDAKIGDELGAILSNDFLGEPEATRASYRQAAEDAASSYGWEVMYHIEYSRTYGGVAVTSGTGASYVPDEAMGREWTYEKLTVDVVRQGIRAVCWASPYQTVGSVADDAALLRFSEIDGIFRKMFQIIYCDKTSIGGIWSRRSPTRSPRFGFRCAASPSRIPWRAASSFPSGTSTQPSGSPQKTAASPIRKAPILF